MNTQWVWGMLAAAAMGCAPAEQAGSDSYAVVHYLDIATNDTYTSLTMQAHLGDKPAKAISKYVLGADWQYGPPLKKPVNEPASPPAKVIKTIAELSAISGVTAADEQK